MQSGRGAYRSIADLYHERDGVAVSKPYPPYNAHSHLYQHEGVAPGSRSGVNQYVIGPETNEEPQWYWRLIAMTSVWMILGGYLILPSTFDNTSHDFLRLSTVALSVTVAAMLTGGYALSALLWFAVRSPIFRQDNLIIPTAGTSAFAFLATLYSLASSTRYNTSSPLCAVALALSACSTIVYGAFTFITSREIRKATGSKSSQRRAAAWADYVNKAQHSPPLPSPVPYNPDQQHDPKYYQNFMVNMHPDFVSRSPSNPSLYQQPAPSPGLPPNFQPRVEEDLVGQNLHGLLQHPDSHATRDAASSTYHLDWPIGGDEDEIDPATGQRRAPTFLPDGSIVRPKAAGQRHDRSKSEGSGGVLGRVMRLGDRSGQGRSREEDASQERRSREERRREIEMGNMS